MLGPKAWLSFMYTSVRSIFVYVTFNFQVLLLVEMTVRYLSSQYFHCHSDEANIHYNSEL